MADSDDEYNRRRGRDKFMKERNDFQDKRRDFGQQGGGGAAGGSGVDRRIGYGQNRPDYKPYRLQGGRPDTSPPMKRMRRDWDDQSFDPTVRRDVSETVGSGGGGPPIPTMGGGGGGHHGSSMMTFKQFLTTQDDSISDEEAIQKFQDYKLEFKRQQLHAFFVAHKEEEWFRLKYHPEDSGKRKTEQQQGVRRRSEAFQDLWEKNWLDKCHLDHDNSRNLIKFMDAVVVKLEGGTDDDLAALDKLDYLLDDSYDNLDKPNEDKETSDNNQTGGAARTERNNETRDSVDTQKKKRPSVTGEEGALSDSEASDKGSVASEKSKSSAPPSVEAGEVDANRDSPEPKHDPDDGTGSTTGGGAESSAVKKEKRSPDSPGRNHHHLDATSATKMMLHKTSSIFLRNLSPAITKSEVEALCKRFPGFLRVALAEPIPDRRFYRRGWVSFRRDVNIKEICWNLNSIRLKDCDMGAIVNRDLTRRIRLANGVTAHKQVAQNDLRLAARLVQIYDRKYNLWQDDGLGGEGDQKRGHADDVFTGTMEFNLTSKNPLLKNITDYLIEEASAEEEELLGTYAKSNEDAEQKVAFERDDKILRVLDRILLYLRVVHSIDYYNHGEYPNEDEMPNRLGLIHVRGTPIPPSQFGMDDKGNTLLAVAFVNEFCKGFEKRLQPLLVLKDQISDDEADKLGRKDPEKEVEAFINANCQELAKDKWLCPLSGKKFKGPEFVRKHILNKHAEKLDEVRAEVAYFNNFLFDAKRPGVPDPKPQPYPMQQNFTQQGPPQHIGGGVGGGGYSNYDRGGGGPQQDFYRSGGGGGYSAGGGGGGGGGGNYYRQNEYGGNYNRRDHYQRRDFGNQQGGGGGYSGGGGNRNQNQPRQQQQHHNVNEGRRDPRVPVTYTDLDAPEDVY